VQELQLYICICQSYTKNIIGSIFFRTRCRNRQQWRAAEILAASHTQPALSREENWEEMERGMGGKEEEWEVRRGDALFCLNVNLGAHVPTPYVASQGRIRHVSESRLVMSAYS